MTKKAKLLERVRNSPKDAKFSEVQKLLQDAGFRERQPKGGSSHYIYCHELLDRIVTLAKGTKGSHKNNFTLNYPIQIEK